MDELERQKRIVEYLRVKSTSHGQIYTFQIAVPNPESVQISPERFEAISHSLKQQGTNFISLLVRRTEAYSEEEEYEVVYGADWCLVAKEIGIEKLWVWVFDMTDEEAQIARQDMELLAGKNEATVPDSAKQIELLLKRFEGVVERKLESKLREQFANMVEEIEMAIERKLESKLREQFANMVEEIEMAIERKLESKLREQFANMVVKIETAIEIKLQEKLELMWQKGNTQPELLSSLYKKNKKELKKIGDEQGVRIVLSWTKDKMIEELIKANQ